MGLKHHITQKIYQSGNLAGSRFLLRFRVMPGPNPVADNKKLAESRRCKVCSVLSKPCSWCTLQVTLTLACAKKYQR